MVAGLEYDHKYKLFDVVASSKEPDQPIGYITGMIFGRVYFKMARNACSPTWDREYPDWTEKAIIYINLFEERPNMTFEQFKDGYEASFENEVLGGSKKERLNDDELYVAYRANVIYVNHISAPEDDLVLIEGEYGDDN